MNFFLDANNADIYYWAGTYHRQSDNKVYPFYYEMPAGIQKQGIPPNAVPLSGSANGDPILADPKVVALDDLGSGDKNQLIASDKLLFACYDTESTTPPRLWDGLWVKALGDYRLISRIDSSVPSVVSSQTGEPTDLAAGTYSKMQTSSAKLFIVDDGNTAYSPFRRYDGLWQNINGTFYHIVRVTGGVSTHEVAQSSGVSPVLPAQLPIIDHSELSGQNARLVFVNDVSTDGLPYGRYHGPWILVNGQFRHVFGKNPAGETNDGYFYTNWGDTDYSDPVVDPDPDPDPDPPPIASTTTDMVTTSDSDPFTLNVIMWGGFGNPTWTESDDTTLQNTVDFSETGFTDTSAKTIKLAAAEEGIYALSAAFKDITSVTFPDYDPGFAQLNFDGNASLAFPGDELRKFGNLESLQLDGTNSALTLAHIVGKNKMTRLWLDDCIDSTADMDAIIKEVESWGTSNGHLKSQGSSSAHTTGGDVDNAITALQSRGWTVEVN